MIIRICYDLHQNCERCRKIFYSKVEMMFFIIYLFIAFLSPMVLIGEREIGWWSVEDGKGKHVIREANLGSLFGLYSIILY